MTLTSEVILDTSNGVMRIQMNFVLLDIIRKPYILTLTLSKIFSILDVYRS